MNTKALLGFLVVISATVIAHPARSQSSTNRPADSDLMTAMTEAAAPGENHKQLEKMAGEWSYKVKWWMNPQTPPSESSGTAVSKLAMGGRYLISNHTGKMSMPGPDGKLMDMTFEGMAIEGYDNAKKKFVSSWIDNMGTGIENCEGTYDPVTRTITYVGTYEPMAGMVIKIRQVVKCTDLDHHLMEMFEDRGGNLVKTMEINYERKH